MRRPLPTLLTTIAAAVLLAGCGAPDDGMTAPETPDETPAEDTPGDTEDPMENGAEDPVGDELADEVAQAIAAAAAETGVAEDDIAVVAAEQVTWSDGSIGCPEPDGMYTQALVEGYRILLDVDGQEIAYHGAEGQPPFRCDDPIDPVEDDAR